MKKFTKAEIEIELLLRGDILTFSIFNDDIPLEDEEETSMDEQN